MLPQAKHPNAPSELDLFRAENATLKRQLADQKQRTDALLASSSWRLTAPVRTLGRWMKRLGVSRGGSNEEAPDSIPLDQYRRWLSAYGDIDVKARAAMQASIAGFAARPTISVVMPVYNIEPRWLRDAIASVRQQIYPHLELCISDDASTLDGVRDVLNEQAAQDQRIRLNFRDTNGHISANSNSALQLATGEYIALLDADDLLSPDALYWVAHAIAAHPDVDMIFSDEDKIGEDGQRFDPYFKSAWNPALMLSQNAFSHLGVFRRSLVEQVGSFREGFEGSQDHDLVLRCAEATSPARIRHIPRILYHWRTIPGSASAGIDSKPYAWHAGRRAIEEHLKRTIGGGSVELALSSYYRVLYNETLPLPLVSILVAQRSTDLRALNAILRNTSYGNFELVVSATADVIDVMRPPARQAVDDPRLRLVVDDEVADLAQSRNRAAAQARGTLLCLLEDGIEPINANWLDLLVARSMLTNVGIAAPMIIDASGKILHAGMVLCRPGIVGSPFQGFAAGSPGYIGRAALEQDFTCVSSACMVIRREAFDNAGGFDADLPSLFNKADLCLRVRRSDLRIVWVPAAQMRQHRPCEERLPAETAKLMRERWGKVIEDDPCYNPNLSLRGDHLFELDIPPRVVLPRGLTPDVLLTLKSSRTANL